MIEHCRDIGFKYLRFWTLMPQPLSVYEKILSTHCTASVAAISLLTQQNKYHTSRLCCCCCCDHGVRLEWSFTHPVIAYLCDDSQPGPLSQLSTLPQYRVPIRGLTGYIRGSNGQRHSFVAVGSWIAGICWVRFPTASLMICCSFSDFIYFTPTTSESLRAERIICSVLTAWIVLLFEAAVGGRFPPLLYTVTIVFSIPCKIRKCGFESFRTDRIRNLPKMLTRKYWHIILMSIAHCRLCSCDGNHGSNTATETIPINSGNTPFYISFGLISEE